MPFQVQGGAPPAKSVTLAKLADGTDGELITWGTSGVAEAVAAGTSGQVLTSNGAGAAPTMQAAAGGAWEVVSTATSSADSSQAFEAGFTSGYDYLITLNDCHLSGNVDINVTYGTGGTPTYGADSYRYAIGGANTTTAIAYNSASDTEIQMFGGGLSSDADDPPLTMEWLLFNPGAANITVSFWKVYTESSNGANAATLTGAGDRNNTTALTAIKFAPASGTITDGDWVVYRRARS